MKALIGQKLGMTQLFDAEGNAVPVTVIQAGPCVVTQVKTPASDGYSAVQLGFGQTKKVSRPLAGHLKKSQAQPKVIREFVLSGISGNRPEAADEAAAGLKLKVGQSIDVTSFNEGDEVMVTGTSKGKGFAGTIKRHNFKRGPKTHGSHNYRGPGSIGGMYPQKVFKGIKMAGQMGNEQVSVRGLRVVKVDTEHNLLAIRGAVPGPRKGVVMIKTL